jgi:hypothetical protein
MKILAKSLLLFSAAVFAPAQAAQTVVDFEGIASWDLVDGYGGMSGWESFTNQLSNYSSFESRDPALGDYRLHARAGELRFDSAPVIFEGMFYNYWGSDTEISFSLYFQGVQVYSQSLDAINQPVDIYWLVSGYSGLVDTIQFHGQSGDGFIVDNLTYSTAPVSVPGAVWLFGSGLAGLMLRTRQRKIG